jgi:hypothetical protein
MADVDPGTVCPVDRTNPGKVIVSQPNQPQFTAPGYQPAPPPGYQAPPGYQPAPGYPPPGYPPAPGYPAQQVPPGHQAPPGYQQPPPGYQQPPPGYQQPPPGYQQPPPGYQQAPPGYQQVPPGYQQAPAGYQPAPGYPSGHQQAPAPQQAPGYQQQAPGPTCRFCGATPTAGGTVHGHRGMIFLMQFRTLKGPYCRDCGIATVRDMSAATLWQGWWGVASVFITPIVLLINLVQRIRFDGLAEPVRAYGSPPPIDKGKPLYQRPAIVGVLVPLFLVVLIGISVINDL